MRKQVSGKEREAGDPVRNRESGEALGAAEGGRLVRGSRAHPVPWHPCAPPPPHTHHPRRVQPVQRCAGQVLPQGPKGGWGQAAIIGVTPAGTRSPLNIPHSSWGREAKAGGGGSANAFFFIFFCTFHFEPFFALFALFCIFLHLFPLPSPRTGHTGLGGRGVLPRGWSERPDGPARGAAVS